MRVEGISEEKAIYMLRNAILVAGQEMGMGDAAPIIKDTVYHLMKDYEDLKTERRVTAELKIHNKALIDSLEENLPLCPESLRPKAEAMIASLRELYAARFDPVPHPAYAESDLPIHARRMLYLVKTLEDEDA